MTQPSAPVAPVAVAPAAPASVHAWWTPFIVRGAQARGLDPQAVLAVARQEGLSGTVGDGGHAFGPFQMNDAGGVLTGRPGNHRAFAEGRAGINAALDGMSAARGLRGHAAINAIVTHYERPLDPAGEIARASASYTPGSPGSLVPLGSPGSIKTGIEPGAPGPLDGAAQIRQQARDSFAKIAAGGSPEDAFASMSHFVHTMNTTLPQIHPETLAVAKANPSSLEAQAVNLAQKYIGVKYTWGGTNAKTGFDCSGLIQHVWGALGKSVPRTTYAQWDSGTPVANNDLKPGDAIFFTGSDAMNGKPGHEGMYMGQGKFIEAAHSGTNVRVSTLAGRTDYVGARRFA